MKRFLTLMVAVCAFFAASAQFPMVTLSHNGELSFFNSVSAFEEAVEAAEDGDILYLSEGKFATRHSEVIINKRINIQGTGYASHLLGNLYFEISTSSSVSGPMKLDGLRLQNLAYGVNTQLNVENAEISKCKIEYLYSAGCAGRNVVIDRCFIGSLECGGADESNVVVKNSKIKYTYNEGVGYITVINSHIKNGRYLPRVTIASILGEADGYSYYSTATVNTIVQNTYYLADRLDYSNSSVTVSDCYSGGTDILDDDADCTIDLKTSGFGDQDGKEIGIFGGDTAFNENPSVPTVDTANSSVEYDSSANKLKVNITVKAD